MSLLHGRDPFTDALLNSISGQNGGTDYSTVRLPAPSANSSDYKSIGETVFFNNDSEWKVESYKIIGSILPAADFMEAVSINGLFLVVTYVVRNNSQSTEIILASPQISDERGNNYAAYNMEAMYIKRVMYTTSKTISLEQLNPQINYTFSAIYQIPDADRVLMFKARELASIVPDTKAIYLVAKNVPIKATLVATKATPDAKPESAAETNTSIFQNARMVTEQLDAVAQSNLGIKYHYGEGVTKNYAEAVKWYLKAAKQGNAVAQNNLGAMYSSGQGVLKDYTEAVKWYIKAAEQGVAVAQYNLGLRYENGEGVPKDDAVEAVKWYRKAADQGYAPAQNNLGKMYDNGTGVPNDDAEAVKWYRLAADQEFANAQYNLGYMYQTGQGVPKDSVEAVKWIRVVKWYRLAAGQGIAMAQNNLGNCYYNGTGVQKDNAEAVKWYRLAAEQRNADSQNNLGNMYFRGEGVPKDHAKAVKSYRLAADQGDAPAQYNLGVMYYNGYGVQKDLVQAHVWWYIAGASRNVNAKKNLAIVEKEMTNSQKKKAINLGRELLAKLPKGK